MKPKISVVLPMHWMENWAFFLGRALASIEMQSFKDYEIIITKHGKMAENSNAAMLAAKGELVKILYMDDYFAHDQALQNIVDNFTEKDTWLVTGCLHEEGDGAPKNPHFPRYSEDIHTGNNCIGSPSVLTLRNGSILLFDEKLSFMLDCDLYKRLHDTYGEPKILNQLDIVIGLHSGQVSQLMSNDEKVAEAKYTMLKHV